MNYLLVRLIKSITWELDHRKRSIASGHGNKPEDSFSYSSHHLLIPTDEQGPGTRKLRCKKALIKGLNKVDRCAKKLFSINWIFYSLSEFMHHSNELWFWRAFNDEGNIFFTFNRIVIRPLGVAEKFRCHFRKSWLRCGFHRFYSTWF